MYMRVTRGRWPDPATLDTEAGRQVLQDLIAAVTRLPGNQSYVTGMDRANGRTVAVSTWDTEEHARFTLDAVGDVPSRLQALGLQLEPSEFFEVTSPT